MVPASFISLSALKDIENDFNDILLLQRNHKEAPVSTAVPNIHLPNSKCYDFVCIVLESKFQYISMDRGKQLALLELTIIDNSYSKQPPTIPETNGCVVTSIPKFCLRLWGQGALNHQFGIRRITRGSAILICQASAMIDPNTLNIFLFADNSIADNSNNGIPISPMITSDQPRNKCINLKLSPEGGLVYLIISKTNDVMSNIHINPESHPIIYKAANELVKYSSSDPTFLLSRYDSTFLVAA